MNNENVYKLYLEDLGHLINEIVVDWKKEKTNKAKPSDYDLGYEMGLHQIISLIQNQANVFQIDLKSINLEKVDTEKDLLTIVDSNS